MTEQEWIERLRLLLPKGGEVLASAEEDCAVIRLSEERYLLLTTDALVEGVHFQFSYFTFYDLGYKLAAVNLSDVAAMGGRPLYALLTLGANRTLEWSWLKELLLGIKEALAEHSASLVGGDTVRSKTFFLNLALVGETERPILRAYAKPGERIFLSRPLGGSSAFLRMIKEMELEKIPENLRLAHLRPSPEVRLGRLLGPLASAMIDISDGLLLDLYRICRASQVGALLDLRKIPLYPLATMEDALCGGEDYALLFTIQEEKVEDLKMLVKELNRQVYEIGVILEKEGLFIKDEEGVKTITPRGYDHFTSQPQS